MGRTSIFIHRKASINSSEIHGISGSEDSEWAKFQGVQERLLKKSANEDNRLSDEGGILIKLIGFVLKQNLH